MLVFRGVTSSGMFEKAGLASRGCSMCFFLPGGTSEELPLITFPFGEKTPKVSLNVSFFEEQKKINVEVHFLK